MLECEEQCSNIYMVESNNLNDRMDLDVLEVSNQGGQLQEVFTELTCVPDLETTPGGGEDVGEEGGEAMITHENSYIISCVKKVTSAYM